MMKKPKHHKLNILSLSLMAMSAHSFALDSSIHQPEGGNLVIENKLIDDSDPNYVYTDSLYDLKAFIAAGNYIDDIGNVNLELNNVTIDSVSSPVNNGIRIGSVSKDASVRLSFKDSAIHIQKDPNSAELNGELVGIDMLSLGASSALTFEGQYDINLNNSGGKATGIYISANNFHFTDDKTAGSSINVVGKGAAQGIVVMDSLGTNIMDISADINVLSVGSAGSAVGIHFNTIGSNTLISNGNITVGSEVPSDALFQSISSIGIAYYANHTGKFASVTNNGTITIDATTTLPNGGTLYGSAKGIDFYSYANAELINNGSIYLSSQDDGYGINLVSDSSFAASPYIVSIYNKEIVFNDVVRQTNNNKGIHTIITEGVTLNIVSDTITNSDVGIFTHTYTDASDPEAPLESKATTNITVTNQITANSIGILASEGTHNITLKEGAFVQGGTQDYDSPYYYAYGLFNAAGILLHPALADLRNTINLERGAKLYSLNDMAIYQIDSGGNSTTTINNAGIITGQIDISSVHDTTTLNNQAGGTLELQNYASGSKDEVMFHLGGTNSVLNNDGLIKFSDKDAGDTATPSNAVFNVATFNNNASGVIDLTSKNNGSNNLVGDTVTINGQYVANGGQLNINTELNGNNSVSDQLIVNGDVVLGSEATLLSVTPTLNSLGVKTTGDGIQVISVSGTSDDQAFSLKGPLTAGAYEYILDKGQLNENWYLSNVLRPTEPEEPEEPEIVLRNPSTAAYLANQTAASALFMHNLHDRQGSVYAADDGKQGLSAWMKASTSNTKNQSINGSMNVDTDSNLLHLGTDIANWQVQEGNVHLGLMAAYGETESKVQSKATKTRAKGKVTGYSVGVYGTWFADQDQGKGLYVDSWAQYGWYKNKVTGAGQVNKEEKYDSNNFAVSLEMGYGLHLFSQGNTEVILTPQVQVAYNHYKADDHQDGNNLKVSGLKANDVITRVGARLYGKAVTGYTAKPYLEANWLHHTAKNELSFNGEVLKDGVPKDRAEVKLGLQGTIAKSWKVWGQVGTQWGGNGYTRYEGQVGVNYQW
ncbi:autotransporter outer membrane beta-barrel domain-containing protein [Neisseria sp. Ec49-e6-T10]|uniref:autotransporter family protein n=1 Tax=Neisseria sp. Ec49-e6-T10 TaxID=3140744 RepID=UPI003EB7E4B9